MGGRSQEGVPLMEPLIVSEEDSQEARAKFAWSKGAKVLLRLNVRPPADGSEPGKICNASNAHRLLLI